MCVLESPEPCKRTNATIALHSLALLLIILARECTACNNVTNTTCVFQIKNNVRSSTMFGGDVACSAGSRLAAHQHSCSPVGTGTRLRDALRACECPTRCQSVIAAFLSALDTCASHAATRSTCLHDRRRRAQISNVVLMTKQEAARHDNDRAPMAAFPPHLRTAIDAALARAKRQRVWVQRTSSNQDNT